MLLSNFLFPLNSPTDLLAEGVETSKLSVDDITAELSKVDDIVGETKEDDLLKVDDKKEVKEGEETSDESELEEPEIADEELDDVQDVPRKEILAKYPTLFKEFPQLEKAYYREKKYAELLPTIDDAKEAVEKSQNYDQFSQSLLNGELTDVLNSIKSTDNKAFTKIVDNYLPTLAKTDQNAYYHVIGGVIKNTIAAMVREGQNIENDNLKAAAVILNQFIFGSSDFKAPTNFGPEKTENDEQTTQLNSERAEFIKEKFESVLDDLSTKSQNIIKSTISQHIDPKNVMTDYVKRTAIRDAIDSVEELINGDARFKSSLDGLWKKAFELNFNKSSLENIRKAYLNKAKTLLPSVIQKHRNEALKGLGKRITEDREEPSKKGLVSPGRASAGDSSRNEKTIPKGMKTLDYLMSD